MPSSEEDGEWPNEPSTRTEPPARAPSRRRWLIPAATAGAVLIVAIVVAVALSGDGGGSGSPDVEGLTPVQIAELYTELYAAGDVEGFQALLSSDATFSGSPYFDDALTSGSTSEGRHSRYLAATGGLIDTACGGDETSVSCTWEVSNIFSDLAGELPALVRHTFAFEDGVIVRRGHSGHHIPFFGSGHPVNAVQGAQYREWLKETYPGEVEDLLVLSELNLSTDEKIQRHRLLTAEWVASLP